jgi:hypothetical protein
MTFELPQLNDWPVPGEIYRNPQLYYRHHLIKSVQPFTDP